VKRLPCHYQVGDKVIVEQDPNCKHSTDRYKGPYAIHTINDNGTVKLVQGTNKGGVVYQTWNVLQIAPYKDWSPLYNSDNRTSYFWSNHILL